MGTLRYTTHNTFLGQFHYAQNVILGVPAFHFLFFFKDFPTLYILNSEKNFCCICRHPTPPVTLQSPSYPSSDAFSQTAGPCYVYTSTPGASECPGILTVWRIRCCHITLELGQAKTCLANFVFVIPKEGLAGYPRMYLLVWKWLRQILGRLT